MKLSQSKLFLANQVNAEQTINSGQVFLWEQLNHAWYGIDGQNIIKIAQEPFSFESLSTGVEKFFRFDDGIEKIIKELSKDEIVKKAIKNSPRLRLLNQDPFQCYISFIVSSNSNIQNIKNSLQKICKNFGKKVKFDRNEFFVFPTPEELSKAKTSELLKCGLGYRAKFVKQATKDVVDKKINFKILQRTDYHTAKSALIETFGIGNKVADCILLFSLNKLEAFPLDRWMIRILGKYFPHVFSLNDRTLTPKKYDELHEEIVEYFGPYAGYTQQFLFKMERDLNQKKWL